MSEVARDESNMLSVRVIFSSFFWWGGGEGRVSILFWFSVCWVGESEVNNNTLFIPFAR